MKKTILAVACLSMALFAASCGNASKKEAAKEEPKEVAFEVNGTPFYVGEDGYVTIFDGTSLAGWRGYGKDHVPSRWTIDEGSLAFKGTGTGEGQTAEGGDIIFDYKFKNFTLEFDWKVEKGANSGVFYLAQEVRNAEDTGWEPIYISAPEYQILDNANHPDALLGVDGNRQSSSLYDMIPAKPQNSKPFGEWNTAKILVYKGTVVHFQNDEKVLEYHLWTPQWTELLQKSKFSQEAWPRAFELLNNLGGDNHEGFIGFQDHGDNVYFRNIRVKLMD